MALADWDLKRAAGSTWQEGKNTGEKETTKKKKLNKIKHGNHTTEEDQEDPSICAVVGDLRRNEGLRYGL